ncbi:MAG: chromosome segregation protein SMC [Lactobacillaceae bacterium]|jgi:chromosome segregation protein|nr:chromosome segregation protein SMC [Lactobacillaceae bacterium]
MKLKTLEISGFKSFADRTKIDFMPGITGVVGPNGSGKSNIIESIRWVMGETSAKGLRGDKMADVIFGGTNKRAALNRAEVSITFDNEDHYLNSEFNEIRITRTLYRNGDSKYQINGKTVRLRDIHELFMDSGLGRESFSIISQGRVESIFSAKPEERRSIIEDVAGVFKYKQNKDKAEKELAATMDNLHRVQDILYELEGRVEPLAEQASRAKDYVNTKRDFDQLDQSRIVLELTDFYAEQRDVITQVEQAESANEQETANLSEQTLAINQLKVQRAELETRREGLQSELLNLTQQVERLTGEQKLQAERAANRSTSTREIKSQIDQVNDRLASLQTTATERENDLQTAEAKAAELDAIIAEKQANHPRVQLTANDVELSKVRTELVDAMQALSTAKNAQTFLAKEHQQNEATAERLQARLAILTEQLNERQAKVRIAQTAQSTKQADLTTAQKDLAQQQTTGQALQAEHQAKRQAWFATLEKQQQAQTRLESLKRLSNNYDGYFQGVKHLMNAKNQFSGIRGVVAELINVPSDYSLAIETALGGALQQVIVEAEKTAKDAIRYLAQHRLGRVTFLPIATIKARQLQPQQLQAAQAARGFVGVAADLVHTDNDYQTILQNLLGTTLIIDNLDNAVELGKTLQHRVRLVTLDGQVMNAGGSMTGGANRNQGNGLLSQQAEVDELAKSANQIQADAKALETNVHDLEAQLAQITTAYTAQQQVVMQANEAVQQSGADLQLAQGALQQVQRELEGLQFELHQTSDGTDDQDSQVNQNAVAITTNEQQVSQLQDRMQQLNDRHASLTAEVNDADEALTAVRAELAGLQASQTAAEVRLTDVAEQITAEQERLAGLQQQLVNLTADQSMVQSQISLDLTAVQAKLTQAQTDMASVSEALGALNTKIQNAESQLEVAQELQRNALKSLNALSGRQAELRTRIAQDEQALDETYETTYEFAKAEMSDMPLDDIRTQLKLLKLTLADIGTVNLAAIEEYDEVKERFDFLTTQQRDLLDAQNNLRQTMSEMDEEVELRFKTTFDAIAIEFATIFEKMFGGGQAVLELTDPSNLLTTGVDIKAQPPGKKFQQMSLLSGGEKALTAISLLFAILEVRPVPFAVLDETEAALDEANVDRFAHYLHEVNSRTQFIVITHRKGTMTNADVLYGVTMQEPGVSTMVSVNLTDFTSAK